MTTLEHIAYTKNELKLAQDEYNKALYAHFYVGALVRFKFASNHGWQAGEVEAHSRLNNGDVRIKLSNLDRFIWIRSNNHWGQLERVEG